MSYGSLVSYDGVAASPAADAIHASLLGVGSYETLQDDLEFASGVLERAAEQIAQVSTQRNVKKDRNNNDNNSDVDGISNSSGAANNINSDHPLNTSERERMKIALVLDAMNRIEESLSV
ncbi:hypothetical protein LSM04_007956 [Trypanosoma melophagium]|uniref:uncharacterized protein n=1 Tax=Trypanosoma melophagium TaxID=715481 RepID=UPI00351A685F|nr:hypothetical protein LSM04_007956 [Trypanosoma melophagium]